MGNRDYKKFAPGSYYHVYNRGVNKNNIFNEAQDYDVFLSRLRENLFPEMETTVDKSPDGLSRRHTPYKRKKLPKDSFSLVAYCLMPNHFHLLIKQNSDLPISAIVTKVCTSYSKYYNLKYKRVGALFQDQFKSVCVDTNEYLIWLSAYIHLNPVLSGLIKSVGSWDWSSGQEYLNLVDGSMCDKSVILEQYNDINQYNEALNDALGAILERKYSEVEIAYAEFEPLQDAHRGEV